jgi:hypothetical protein
MIASLLSPFVPNGHTLTALLVVICFSAGLNVYATVAMLGVLARVHVLMLPPSLGIVENCYVISACAIKHHGGGSARAGAGETALDSATTTGCTDPQPQVGITSTPAIDGDLGSGGVLPLPGSARLIPEHSGGSRKRGKNLVVNRDQMTTNNSHYTSGSTNDRK